eukprot:9637008-Lingulodinium_polyedra.AAC.1
MAEEGCCHGSVPRAGRREQRPGHLGERRAHGVQLLRVLLQATARGQRGQLGVGPTGNSNNRRGFFWERRRLAGRVRGLAVQQKERARRTHCGAQFIQRLLAD